MKFIIYLFILTFTIHFNVYAQGIGADVDDIMLDTSTLSEEDELRYRALIHSIRCPVCQGQSIGESDADLSRDLRNVVYNMIKEEKSDDEIIAFLTDRYGNFVTFEPPFNSETFILWILPWVVLIFFIVYFIRYNRKNRLRK